MTPTLSPLARLTGMIVGDIDRAGIDRAGGRSSPLKLEVSVERFHSTTGIRRLTNAGRPSGARASLRLQAPRSLGAEPEP